ncbi:MAG: hypothetical protein H6641_04555 [Caldilineaceae bacterium]|nr:hypothetical protein [Caldilineaceae bacterium]
MDKKQMDPTPENFNTYEEAAEFWDTHDTTEYLDEFRTVEVISSLRARHFEVEIAEDVIKALQVKAKQQGVTISHLASNLLRQQL